MAKKYNPWTGFLEDTATKANDEKPTIDKAIHSMDSAKYDAREVYNILAQALQNSTNPNKVSELISKAQGKLLEMSARAKDSKCKTAVDKAIHSCDAGEVDILFYVDIDGNKVHETFSSNSAMNSRLNELKKHGIKRFKTWSHAEWTKSESEFRNMFNKIKGSL